MKERSAQLSPLPEHRYTGVPRPKRNTGLPGPSSHRRVEVVLERTLKRVHQEDQSIRMRQEHCEAPAVTPSDKARLFLGSSPTHCMTRPHRLLHDHGRQARVRAAGLHTPRVHFSAGPQVPHQGSRCGRRPGSSGPGVKPAYTPACEAWS
ncbi:hypothetical protein SKAU_G00242940 [Synaphobranchus kaupii]|uniref:Uncharacterized protein n=1 Tax=Synaphobranchus kaupii TaxID=118154 RepID=A0A9Q1F819_SYNKA|nr:hypothetical protein SKAU_G00242940 [Synaphobranchus kaupii]